MCSQCCPEALVPYGFVLQTKDKTELDGVEDYVYARILANDKSWVPRSRYMGNAGWLKRYEFVL
jgi:hypothetical protein